MSMVERCCWDASASGCPFHGPATPPGADTRAEALAEVRLTEVDTAALVEAALGARWPDGGYGGLPTRRTAPMVVSAMEQVITDLIRAHVAQVLAASLAQEPGGERVTLAERPACPVCAYLGSSVGDVKAFAALAEQIAEDLDIAAARARLNDSGSIDSPHGHYADGLATAAAYIRTEVARRTTTPQPPVADELAEKQMVRLETAEKYRAQYDDLAEKVRALPAAVAREVHESYCGAGCLGGKNCEGALGKREKQILRAAVRRILPSSPGGEDR